MKQILQLEQKLFQYKKFEIHYKNKYPKEKNQIKYIIKDFKSYVEKYDYMQLDEQQKQKLEKEVEHYDGRFQYLEDFFKSCKKIMYSYQTYRSLYYQTAFRCYYYDYILSSIQPRYKISSESSEINMKQNDIFDQKSILDMKRHFIFKLSHKYEFFYFKHLNFYCRGIFGVSLGILSLIVFFIQIVGIINQQTLQRALLYMIQDVSRVFTFCIMHVLMIYQNLCVYFFLFRFNFFHQLGFRWGKKTNVIALLNSSSMITYFLFPFIINFYGLFYSCKDSSLEQSLGEKKVMTIDNVNFQDFFSIIFFLTFIFVIFGLVGRIMKFLGFQTNSVHGHIKLSKLKSLRKEFRNIFPEVYHDYSFSKDFQNDRKRLCQTQLCESLLSNVNPDDFNNQFYSKNQRLILEVMSDSEKVFEERYDQNINLLQNISTLFLQLKHQNSEKEDSQNEDIQKNLKELMFAYKLNLKQIQRQYRNIARDKIEFEKILKNNCKLKRKRG